MFNIYKYVISYVKGKFFIPRFVQDTLGKLCSHWANYVPKVKGPKKRSWKHISNLNLGTLEAGATYQGIQQLLDQLQHLPRYPAKCCQQVGTLTEVSSNYCKWVKTHPGIQPAEGNIGRRQWIGRT